MSTNFQELSYQKHREHFESYQPGAPQADSTKHWFEQDTVNAWRLSRMYRQLDPLLALEPEAEWLTVGDGRFGLDAKYIADKGNFVLATDISEALLQEGKKMGLITNYQQENAEALSFADEEFDYVFCKEAYHHFPRPMIALYEMLRVARKGVVLMEPNDIWIGNNSLKNLFLNVKVAVKKLLGKPESEHKFEPGGNYLYSFSIREAEKVALGLNYRVIAYRGLNDAYLKGVETEKIHAQGPLQKRIKFMIKRADFFCRLGLADYGLITVIIYKDIPDNDFLNKLSQSGFIVVRLPENPYIN